MSKNLLQDMVKMKTITRTEGARQAPTSLKVAQDAPVRLVHPDFTPTEPTDRPRYMLWLVAILSIVFCLYSISFLFLKAEVTVNPKTQNIVLNENLSASLDGGEETLPFDLMVISGEESKIMQTTLEKDVSEKAKGTVVIYNNFSSATQRLDIDTRLEGSDGKIYKTVKQIVVPGMKGSVPGSIEVNVYAANPGEEYNSGPLDFTIFGFKGTPKYSKFYARSKGEMVGGFKGKASVISDADKLATINDLKAILQTKLIKKATDQIPSGFILFKDGVFFNIDENNIDLTKSGDKTLPITIKGTLQGILLSEEKLTTKIAEKNISDYDDSLVYIPNIRDLTFSLSSKESISLRDVKNINFNLAGTTKIVWKVDESGLQADLLGKSKKDFSQILLQYPNIDSADLIINPFWKKSLPNKSKNIKIIVNYPK